MLNNKDYCDYDTCVALKELGYDDSTDLRYNDFRSLGDFLGGIKAPTLYEAQKWLREEKGIHISIDYDEFEWSYCLFDCSKKHYKQLSNCRMYFKSYEEVLLNGIKVSVEFLKEK